MTDEKTHENGICMACGGKVDAHGMSEGGEVESQENEMGSPGSPMPAANDSNPAEDDDNVRAFVKALGHKGKR